MLQIVKHQVQYHLVMTQRCNLSCTYCGQEPEPSVMPIDLEYTVEQLRQFASKHDKPPIFAFYGGEPLLKWERMRKIIDHVPASDFMLQTNGTMIHRIPDRYLSRFQTILLSIDGRKEITDTFRGDGVYDKVIQGGKSLLDRGFKGELIARMTVSVGSDIEIDVKHLISTKLFDVIHWQLNVMWDIPDEEEIRNFSQWVDESYNPGISSLIQWWVEELKEGRFHQIAPFMGVIHGLITGENAGLKCGAGEDFFAITTDGRITACPIPPSLVFPILGNIIESRPSELPGQIGLTSPCNSCNYLKDCGGRCLYTNLTKHWGEHGFKIVCKATQHLIDELKRVIPNIKEMLGNKFISIDLLKYPRIPNGVEVIP